MEKYGVRTAPAPLKAESKAGRYNDFLIMSEAGGSEGMVGKMKPSWNVKQCVRRRKWKVM